MNATGWLAAIGALLGMALLLTAALSALETLTLLLKRHRLKVLMEADPKLRRVWGRLADHPEAYLTQVVALGVMTQLLAVTLAIVLLEEGAGLSGRASADWAWLAAGGVLLLFCLDFFPKLLALWRPAFVCRTLAGPFLVISHAFSPLAASLARAVADFTRRLIPRHVMPRRQLLSEELPAMVALRSQSGVLSFQESQAIHEILRLSRKTAKDCMTPRHEVSVLDRRLPSAEVFARVRQDFHYWFPVSDGDADAIVGLLDGWGLMLDAEEDVERHIQPPLRVPETMPAIDLLYHHLYEPHRLAVVIDEYGGFEGVVSHSDLLEEVLEDSVPDPANEEEILVLQPGRRVQVLGHARLDELGEVLGLELERDGLDTIGGLVYNEVGRLPRQHETVHCGPLAVTVTKVIGARIEEMIVELHEENDEKGRRQ